MPRIFFFEETLVRTALVRDEEVAKGGKRLGPPRRHNFPPRRAVEGGNIRKLRGFFSFFYLSYIYVYCTPNH